MSYPQLRDFKLLDQHQKALTLAFTCQFIHQYPDVPKKWTTRIGLDRYTTYYGSASSVEYLFFITEDYQFLIINGTDVRKGLVETIRDLSVSLNFFPKKGLKSIRYHGGYYRSAIAIMRDLKEKNLLIADVPLVLSGHSMGGAVAKIIANESAIPPYEVFTYGTPQTSMINSDVINDTSNAFHYVKKGDMIPYYPSTLYFDHIPVYRISGGRVELHTLRRTGALIPTMRRLWEVVRRNDGGIFHPHAVTTYIRHLIKVNKK